MGACEGVKDWDCEGGHKFTGPGMRKWSCWVIDKKAAIMEWEGKLAALEDAKRNGTKAESENKEEVTMTDAMFTPSAVVTGAMASGSLMSEFTAGATGSY